ncbi:MAG: Asp-tRNA(Asn)/Glu-tRNA(Gln) amidotransferase subunit GatB [Pseudomonadota bacterium]
MGYECVIGLEVHAQLNTKAKLFSVAPTAYGAEPNAQASPVDLAFPGTLPVLNEAVLDKALRFGLACGATIAPVSVFARKNYFYPDLPKGYQISQFEQPIVGRGALTVPTPDGRRIEVGITRAHLEEDAGKSVHDRFEGATGVDLNRAGTPLLEIVSEPDLRSPSDAVAYLKALHKLVRYLDICDGNMAEGSFRCDANVSIRPVGSEVLGTRTELKNLNSFKFVQRAIGIEIERQTDVLDSGGAVVQETRLFDPDRDETRAMRGKEEAMDYRYFPDPDLLPVRISDARLTAVAASMPELPEARRTRYVETLGLSPDDAAVLTAQPSVARYFDELCEHTAPDLAAKWVSGSLLGALNESGLDATVARVMPGALSELLTLVSDDVISSTAARDVFAAMWRGEGTAAEIVERDGLRQISDTNELAEIVAKVLGDHPEQEGQYRAGKHKVLGFLVGKVMQRTQGKANPGLVNTLLKVKLGANDD